MSVVSAWIANFQLCRACGKPFEELYDLENDPMQWTNLIHSDLDRAEVAIAELKTHLPAFEAEEILKSQKDDSIKEMDHTIKTRRDLRSLK